MICGENGHYGQIKRKVESANGDDDGIFVGEDILDEIYVINIKTHQIYFPHGIFADGMMYITF